jgi:hypothetical protein
MAGMVSVYHYRPETASAELAAKSRMLEFSEEEIMQLTYHDLEKDRERLLNLKNQSFLTQFLSSEPPTALGRTGLRKHEEAEVTCVYGGQKWERTSQW